MRNKLKKTDTGVVVNFTGSLVGDDDAKLCEWLGEDFICPRDIADAIALAGGGPICLRMNSIGGSLFAGAEIYTRLMEYPGPVTVDILSVSASASSAVAMASAKEGGRCRISPLGMMVIHNVQGEAEGDYREMEEMALRLQKANGTIVAAYRRKTGMEEVKLREMLDRETWLTAEEAVSLGFADEVMFQEGQPQADAGTVSAVMARTRELVNAIPRLDAAALRRVMENRQRETQEEELRMAARLLELEEARF